VKTFFYHENLVEKLENKNELFCNFLFLVQNRRSWKIAQNLDGNFTDNSSKK